MNPNTINLYLKKLYTQINFHNCNDQSTSGYLLDISLFTTQMETFFPFTREKENLYFSDNCENRLKTRKRIKRHQ